MKLKQPKPEEELTFKAVPWLRQMAIAYLRYGKSGYAKEKIRERI